jgi:hypothetical protein
MPLPLIDSALVEVGAITGGCTIGLWVQSATRVSDSSRV